MSGKWMKFHSGIAVSLLTLSLVACEAGTGPGSGSLLEPGVEAVYNQGNSASFRRVKGTDGEGTISATIGLNGGKLTLGDHELSIPRGAVDAPTEFRMTLEDGEHIQVDLTATRTLGDGTVLDVGEQGFPTPVTLKLSYKGVAESVNPTRLIIVWVRPDGSFEPVPSSVNPSGKRVEGFLDHFSRYAVAIN